MMNRPNKQSLRQLEQAIERRAGKPVAVLSSGMSKPLHRQNSLLALEKECRRHRPDRIRVLAQSFDNGGHIAASFETRAGGHAELELSRRPASSAYAMGAFEESVESFDIESTIPHTDDSSAPQETAPTLTPSATTPGGGAEPTAVPTEAEPSVVAAPSVDPATDEAPAEGENTSSESPAAHPPVEPDGEAGPEASQPNEQPATPATVPTTAPAAPDTPVGSRVPGALLPEGERTTSAEPSPIDQPVDVETIDRDLKEVLKNSPVPPLEARPEPVLSKPAPEDGGPETPSNNAPREQDPHKVFENMAKSLASNTFDLGSYKLGNRFAEIEAELDAESGRNQPPASSPIDKRNPVPENEMQRDIESISAMLEATLVENDVDRSAPTKPATQVLPKPEMPAELPATDRTPASVPTRDVAEAPDNRTDASPEKPQPDDMPNAPEGEPQVSPPGTTPPVDEITSPAAADVTSYQVPIALSSDTVNPLGAAAAMLLAWRDRDTIDPAALAAGTGRWQSHKEFLNVPRNQAFLNNWGMNETSPETLSFDALKSHLHENGPIILVATSEPPVVHVVAGAAQDDSGAQSISYFDPSGAIGAEFTTTSFTEYAQPMGAVIFVSLMQDDSAPTDDQGA